MARLRAVRVRLAACRSRVIKLAGNAARFLLPRTGLPRPLGWTVVAAAGGAWIVGAVLGWRELLAISMVCVFALLLGCLFLIGRAGLDLAVEVEPQRVVVGGRAHGGIRAENRTRRRVLPLRVELPVGAQRAAFDLPALAPSAVTEELFTVNTRRRAVIQIGPATSVRGDPLGLLRREVSWADGAQLFVHPRTVPLGVDYQGFLRDMEGSATTILSPSDLAFHAIREYEVGDDRRLIHWPTSAKTGRLMVRQFVETRRSHVAVVLGGAVSEYTDEEAFELGVSVAGSIGVQSVRDEQQQSVVACGRLLNSATRNGILDGLSGVTFGEDGGGLWDSVRLATREAAEASLAVLISGSGTTDSEIRRVSRLFPPGVRIAAIRVGASHASRSIMGDLVLLDLRSLDDLPGLMKLAIYQ